MPAVFRAFKKNKKGDNRTMANIFDLFKQIESKNSTVTGPVSYIVVGLGNPGDKYESTRHNMGFLALENMCDKLNFKIDRLKFKALCGECTFGGKRVLFMKPQTYMNNSGEAVREAADFYKIPAENILIIYDDIAINPGSMRVKRKGSDGGHNGIKSIIQHLGTQTFPRIKIGVGSPPASGEMVNWVLGGIPANEKEAVKRCLYAALPCAELIVEGKLDEAMNKYNGEISE